MTDRVDITVALCTWNRAALLDQTLTALAAVAPPPGRTWEVLVVDNNSPDHTEQILAAHADRLPLRWVKELKQGHSNARNCGLDHARGDWVLWTDDDVRPAPGWLTALAGTISRQPDAAAVGGPIRPWFAEPPDPVLADVFRPLRIGYCGVDHGPDERELAPDEPIYGANMAYRTAVVAGLRFDPTFGRNGTFQGGHDDLDYLQRVRGRGGRVWWSPGMDLEHYVEPSRMTLSYVRRYCRDAVCHDPEAMAADRAPRLAGVPRWLLRKAVAHWLTAAVNLRPGRRRERLAALLELWHTQARITAFRHQSNHQPAT